MFPEPDFSFVRDKSTSQCFEMVFDDEVINFLVTESNKYALFKNCDNPHISCEEIKVFLANLFYQDITYFRVRDLTEKQQEMLEMSLL